MFIENSHFLEFNFFFFYCVLDDKMSTPAVKGNNNGCTLCQRLGIRPFTKRNILYYYAPLQSMVSYG